MLDYPEPLVAYPASWVEELMLFDKIEDLVALERKDYSSLPLSEDLRRFYQRAEELTAFTEAPRLGPMPETSFTFLYVIPKKQHEIRSLAPFVKANFDQKGLRSIVDIGGGIGVLAQALSGQYELPVRSVDMDPVLQKTGMERQRRHSRHRAGMVEYHGHKVDEHNEDFKKLLGPGVMTLGLHTCGELSLHQMNSTISTKASTLVNFGCCYQRLIQEETQNVSEFAQSLSTKIFQNHFSLTLAARAHRKTDEKDFLFKLKVKYYRYAIHLLLHDHFGHREMATLGNSSKKLYDAPFSTYAHEQFLRLGLTPWTPEEFQSYFDNPKRQELIRGMLTAGFIRNVFGRVLEAYILLDRAIYMEESGYETELLVFFDEMISPRNLGLVSQLR